MSRPETGRSPDERGVRQRPNRGRQLLWFIALWLAGLATVGAVAFVIRSVLL